MKKPFLVTAILCLAAAGTATVLGTYGTITGTAAIQEPTYYPTVDDTLTTTKPSNDIIDIANQREFTTDQGGKQFYQHRVTINFSGASLDKIDTVSFDYGNGTYLQCTSGIASDYTCPQTDGSITVNTVKLRITPDPGYTGTVTVYGYDSPIEVEKQ